MSEDEIISSMVKGRECCRQLVRLYETERDRNREVDPGIEPNMEMLANAEEAATRMLRHLEELPAMPGNAVSSGEHRQHVSRLVREIAGLLDKALVLEREMRSTYQRFRKPDTVVHAGALRAYAV